MVVKTVKGRRESEQADAFKRMRGPIRANAQSARRAYQAATEANPDTPMKEVQCMLAADSWEAITELRGFLKEKGWFNPPPKKSQLLNEPACAWLLAGAGNLCLQSKSMPALNKHVLRAAVQHWIENHFLFPVGGTDKDGVHHNLMEHVVTFVWAYYTDNQKPKVPAMTDVGRFMFTYIWRRQHQLLRCPCKFTT